MIEGGDGFGAGWIFTSLPDPLLFLENISPCFNEFNRIHGSSPENDFIMQVRACASSSAPQQADFLMEFYFLPFLDGIFVQMSVSRFQSSAVIDFNQFAVLPFPASKGYHSRRR